MALGIQTARKRLSPAAQLKYQLLNKVGQEKNSVYQGYMLVCTQTPMILQSNSKSSISVCFHTADHIWEQSISLTYTDILGKIFAWTNSRIEHTDMH